MKRYFLVSILMSMCMMATSCEKPHPATVEEALAASDSTGIRDDNGVIRLLAPDTLMKAPLMEALRYRASTPHEAKYNCEMLSLEELSNLLWAANGFNRTDKRTAPSAVNAQDVDIYVCMPFGAYLYDAKAGQLNRITTADLRPAVAGQQAQAATAPVSLVFVSNIDRFPMQNDTERCKLMGQIDAAYVSANVGLFCAAACLETRPRMSADWDALKAGLKLTDKQIGVLNNPVGRKRR